MMPRVLREPLFHFLVAGGALFVLHAWLGAGAGDTPRIVHITDAEVQWLAETWTRQWQRPPDPRELRGIVADYLKQELLAREARELGLEEDDTIVNRRLAQKMQFLVQEVGEFADPTDDEIRAFFASQPEKYTQAARISFTQIFFQDASDAQSALAALPARDIGELGDRSLLEREIANLDKQAVAALFGEAFAGAVFALQPGAWQGPFESAYGFHLVRVAAIDPERPRTLGEAREQVIADWRRERQTSLDAEYFGKLLNKYDLVVDASVEAIIGPLKGAVR